MGTAFAQGYAGAMPQEYGAGWKAKQSPAYNPNAFASDSGRSDTDRTVALQKSDHAKPTSSTPMSRN